MSGPWTSPAYSDVVVLARGRVPVLEGERFAGAVHRQLRRLGVTGGARLRITGSNCGVGPYLVQVNLRLDGAPVRIQVLTQGAGDALPVVVRLENRITALRTPRKPRPSADSTHLPLDTPMPGEIVRRKVFALHTVPPHDAVATLDAMDYAVHLFTDADTGEEAIVYGAPPLGLRLARQRRTCPALLDGHRSREFVVNPRPAPTLTEDQAVHRVCDHGLPFLLYTDPGTRRGHLLYRRYDADLGLITPVTD